MTVYNLQPMQRRQWRPSLLGILFGILLALLILSGWLIYRWVNRASVVDRLQQKELVETAIHNVDREFSGALQEALSMFRPVSRQRSMSDVESVIVEAYAQWRSTAAHPQLIGHVSLVTIAPDQSLTYRRFEPEERRFNPQPWPDLLKDLRHRLQEVQQSRVPPRPVRSSHPPLMFSQDNPVMVFPLLTVPSGSARPQTHHGQREQPPVRVEYRHGLGPSHQEHSGPLMAARQAPTERKQDGERKRSGGLPSPRATHPSPVVELMGWCLVELDAAFVQEQFLPALVKRHFSSADLSKYRLAVVTGHAPRLLYSSDTALKSDQLASVDAATILLRPMSPPATNQSDTRRESESAATANAPAEAWQLVAKHAAGSIDTAVNATRRRNLGIGFGMLVLVGSGTALLMWTAHRARALAQREMELVAGVSHELRTPLSVIQSAGFNLSSGRVKDADRVQQYGMMIQTESRRLSDMIEQMLSYAGIQSGRKQYELAPTSVVELIRRVLADYATVFEEAGWQVETQIEEPLPLVEADPPALESAIKNLLENALKYAAEGRWLRLSARASSKANRPEIEISVEDRGPGIDPQDKPHLFDPFYRGRGLAASAIPGVGLGLSLVQRHVQAHRGRLSVKTAPGHGTTFTIHLPALSASSD